MRRFASIENIAPVCEDGPGGLLALSDDGKAFIMVLSPKFAGTWEELPPLPVDANDSSGEPLDRANEMPDDLK